MSGIYTTLSGLIANERALESVAQNVANASTAGYRARVTTFTEALSSMTDTPLVRGSGVAVDLSRGVVTKTDNPLDLSLDSDGFFALDTPYGRQLTRNGSFRLDARGTLVSHDGHPVVGAHGETIEVPPDARAIHIDPQGIVTAEGSELGRILVVQVDPRKLVPAGTRFAVASDAVVEEVEAPNIEAGTIEGSNFEVVRGMVELIRVTRAHEALTRTLQSHSEIEQRTARGFSAN